MNELNLNPLVRQVTVVRVLQKTCFAFLESLFWGTQSPNELGQLCRGWREMAMWI